MSSVDSLPPMDWHELATKSDLALLKDDLAALEERVNARFEVVDVRLEALRTPIYIALFAGFGT